MITRSQFGLHNREWKSVCTANAWDMQDDSIRLAFYASAGLPATRSAWTNKHFDKFLHACGRALGHDSADNSLDTRARARLIWRIKFDAARAGLNDQYLLTISRDQTGLGCWTELGLDQLENLRNTVQNRAKRKVGAAAESNNPF
jgi:hypothetical protein